MVRYIACNSRATTSLATAQIQTSLLQARDSDGHVQVSDILPFDRHCSFQNLEGRPYISAEALWRIPHSRCHDRTDLLAEGLAPHTRIRLLANGLVLDNIPPYAAARTPGLAVNTSLQTHLHPTVFGIGGPEPFSVLQPTSPGVALMASPIPCSHV